MGGIKAENYSRGETSVFAIKHFKFPVPTKIKIFDNSELSYILMHNVSLFSRRQKKCVINWNKEVPRSLKILKLQYL